ncbi:DUF6778 family protein [Jannaschia pohangensis]|uniref:Uncharacterized protein n=1 Tax=Jannaschia pohangensis TaxID=390807 RepID=A0A1I3V2U9_9RHOB|nr:DUF6778 family protein [Jannaschia pohangensis]SFJ88461.1 hypothetical protein SAMN04488095_0052 [Jannaschia pohangensis]
MDRRGFIIAGAASVAGLSGCVSEPVSNASDLRSFNVVNMRVEADRAVAQAEKPITLTPVQVEEIIRQNALGTVQAARAGGDRDVIIDVLVGRIFVPTVASAGLTARGAAAIDATIQVRDARTGQAIGAPRGLRAHADQRFGGLLGAALTAEALQRNGQAGEIGLAGQALGKRIAGIVYGIRPA